MKNTILIIAAIMSLNVISVAQSSQKKEAIKQLFVVMHQDSMMSKMTKEMYTAMTASINRTMPNMNLNDTASQRQTKMMMEKNMEASNAVMSRMMDEDLVDVYDKHFTMQEIQDFTTFYKTKSGQQLINKLPDITKDIMIIMVTKYGPELQKAMMKNAEEMTKGSHQ